MTAVYTAIGAGLLAALAPAPGGDGIVYVATDGGLYKSADQGATWSLVHAADAGGNLGAHGYDVLFDPGGQDTIYWWEPGSDGFGHVYVSTDGGASFSEVTQPRPGNTTRTNNVAALSATEALIGYDDETVYRTTNGGTSWASTGMLADFAPPLRASASKIWFGSSAGSPLDTHRTNYDGSGAETLSFASGARMINPRNDTFSLHYNGGFSGDNLFKCIGTTITDITPSGAGATDKWRGADTPDGSLMVAHAVVSGGASGTLWRSTDGGASWTSVMSGAALGTTFAYDGSVAFVGDASHVVCMVGDGTDAKAHISSDGGATWSTVTIALGEQFAYSVRAKALV